MRVASKVEQGDLVAAGGLLLLVLALFAKILSEPGQIAYHQDIEYYYALETIVRHILATGELPLWNPYWEGGTLGLGNPQALALYPPMLLLRLLPITAGFNWGAVLHVWLAGLGIYALLRNLGAGRPASLIGGD